MTQFCVEGQLALCVKKIAIKFLCIFVAHMSNVFAAVISGVASLSLIRVDV